MNVKHHAAVRPELVEGQAKAALCVSPRLFLSPQCKKGVTMSTSLAHLSANVERFMGFADVYDAYRPRPPLAVLDILTQLAQTPQPALVVDLGSGTALSTTIWAGRAAAVVGVEPSADMRRQAEARTAVANVRYQEGYANATGLPDACADIVTCSQSLHWMEPDSTFAEIARILRPG